MFFNENDSKKMNVKFSDIIESHGEDVLACPNCGGGFLRQQKIEVFERVGEDSSSGNHVAIMGQKIEIDRDISKNPSGRREGLRIGFDCENCPQTSSMVIYQHKGNTYIGMELD